jgi:3-dehydroquinate dehydratase type I
LKPKICVSLIPKTVQEAIQLVHEAEISGADLVEIRLDDIELFQNIQEISKASKLPLIATNRNPSIQPAGKLNSIMNAAEKGFDYLDLDLSTPELKTSVSKIKQMGAKCIVSHHEFNRSLTLGQLEETLNSCKSSGADVYKIITTAQQYEDNLTLLNFVSKVNKKSKIVSFAMGEIGKISRLLSPVFGGFFTFASLNTGAETASGQMSISEMKNAYATLGFER